MSDKPSIAESVNKEIERLVQAERDSAGKGQASVEATPEGVEASASVDVGRRASAGGFIRRTWRGAIEWGAKFKASW